MRSFPSASPSTRSDSPREVLQQQQQRAGEGRGALTSLPATFPARFQGWPEGEDEEAPGHAGLDREVSGSHPSPCLFTGGKEWGCEPGRCPSRHVGKALCGLALGSTCSLSQLSGSRFLPGIFPGVPAVRASDGTAPAPPETALGFLCLPRVSETRLVPRAAGR